MKKKIIVIIIAIFLFFVLAGVGGVLYYNNGLKAVDSNDKTEVLFEVKPNTFATGVVEKLIESGLVKHKISARIYLKLHGDVAPQAGVYSLNKAMTLEEMLNKMTKGDAVIDSVSVTFVEGKRIPYFVSVVNKNFGYSEEEIYKVISDEAYLKELINKYWFLTDEVLNDRLYYALEGYLCPDTYQFAKDASIKDITEKMLDLTGAHLNKFKSDIENSDFTIHQMLTMASIVELEGSNSDDRKGVAGVFYNRLEGGWSLGSDVTTYYGAKVEMSERDLWQWEIEQVNDYNTRPAAMAGKLPVGPICNPSVKSLEAAIEPENHDYYYFVADKNGKTYFNKTNAEHQATISKLKNEGLWYVYK
jgi:UPF0755 protein